MSNYQTGVASGTWKWILAAVILWALLGLPPCNKGHVTPLEQDYDGYGVPGG
jgi:hypothetical protein